MIKRQSNWLGQQRVDTPHLRLLESSVANDFDVLAEVFNNSDSFIIKGFEFSSWAVGQAADSLILNTASSSLIHPNASEAGSFFSIPESQSQEVLEATNNSIKGSFTPSSANYVGIDLVRSADSTTADLVQFNNPDTNQETGIQVPLARTLNYVIVISTADFSTNSTVCPLYIVTTDSTNKVVSIQDARPLLFRLGTGGSRPNSSNVWGWPGGRNETVSAIAGDLSISSFKDWLDAIMTRLFELGGGEFWYSNTSDRNVQVLYSSVFVSTGEPYEIVSSNVHWKGVTFFFDNSTGHKNQIVDQTTSVTGLTDLTNDGDCIYVDLDRAQDRTVALSNAIIAQKGNLTTLGTSSPPGSRYVLIVRVGSYYYTRGQYMPVGSVFRVATTSTIGGVKLNATPQDSNSPYVATIIDVTDQIIGAGGFSRTSTGTTGNLYIGGAAGDYNIILGTSRSADSVQVLGSQIFSNAGCATFTVTNQSTNLDARITNFKSLSHSGAEGVRVYVDTQGAIGQSNVLVRPEAPTSTELSAGLRTVYFTRPSKFWLPNAVAAHDPNLGTTLPTYTVTINGSGQKELVAAAPGQLVVDGQSPSNGDVVLIVTADANSGPYVVISNAASGGNWVLDRAPFFLTTSKVSQGMAIYVEGGTKLGGQYYTLTTAEPIVLDTTSPLFWSLTDSYNTDQFCVRHGDGLVTVIEESAPYAGVS